MNLHNTNAVLGGFRLGRGDVKANGLSGMASGGGWCSGRGQDEVLTSDSGELVLRCAGAAAVGTVLVGLWLGVVSGVGQLEAGVVDGQVVGCRVGEAVGLASS